MTCICGTNDLCLQSYRSREFGFDVPGWIHDEAARIEASCPPRPSTTRTSWTTSYWPALP